MYGNPLDGAGPPQRLTSPLEFQSLEGPIWNAAGKFVLFSDVVEANAPGAQIYKFLPGTNQFSVYAYPDAPVTTNGLAFDNQNRLLACERSNGQVVRIDNGARIPIASMFKGAPLGAPNDIVTTPAGNTYFTDTIWGRTPGHEHGPTDAFRITPSGELIWINTSDIPNGIVVSADGAWLYVGNDTQPKVWRAPLAEDGAVSGDFVDFISKASRPEGQLSTFDGLCVDDAGNLYVANNNGAVHAITVFDSDAKFLGKIDFPPDVAPSNCTFGGDDRKTLYVTAGTALWSIKLNVPGLP